MNSFTCNTGYELTGSDTIGPDIYYGNSHYTMLPLLDTSQSKLTEDSQGMIIIIC